MGFWKIVGGCAIGAVAAIGVVVLLPVAGPVLTITAAGAAIAGATGAVVGGITAAASDESGAAGQPTAPGHSEREAAEARTAERVRRLDEALREVLARLEDESARHDLIVTAYAVGLAICAVDGPVSAERRDQIREFTGGVTHQDLPDHVKRQLEEIERCPPNLDTAWTLAQRRDPAHRELLDGVVQTLCESLDPPSPQRSAFLAEWRNRSQTVGAKEASNA